MIYTRLKTANRHAYSDGRFKSFMTIKKLGIVALSFSLLLSANIYSDTKIMDLEVLYSKEKSGIRYYNKGKFEDAFNELSLPAKVGLKSSQYYLAFMYLKGQYVPQSIEEGMGWLGVANEIEVDEWRLLYNSLYSRLTDEQKQKVDLKVTHYIERYGMKTQKIRCQNRAKLGSRKKEVYCDKRTGATTPLFE